MSKDTGEMTRTTENTEWVYYEMSMAEFKRRLGIEDPETVLTVSTTGGRIKITMSHHR